MQCLYINYGLTSACILTSIGMQCLYINYHWDVMLGLGCSACACILTRIGTSVCILTMIGKQCQGLGCIVLLTKTGQCSACIITRIGMPCLYINQDWMQCLYISQDWDWDISISVCILTRIGMQCLYISARIGMYLFVY